MNPARQKPRRLAERLHWMRAALVIALVPALGCLDFHELRERAAGADGGSVEAGASDGSAADGSRPRDDGGPSRGGSGGTGGSDAAMAGAGGEPSENRAPLAAIDFPRTGATPRDRIRVRGSARDPDGDGIATLTLTTGAGEFDALDTLQRDGTFIAEVELAEGEQSIELAIEDERGQRASATVGPVERTSFRFAGPAAAVLDASGERALTLDARDLTLVAIDLESGARTVLAPETDGPLEATADLALDAENDRVLVADPALSALRAVALDDGTSTELTPAGDALRRVVVDAAHDRALVLYANAAQLGTVPLAGGTLQPLAGSGPALMAPHDLALDLARNRAIVTDGDGDEAALIAVDLETGARSPVSGEARGRGPLGAVRDLVIDAANDRALVVQARADHYAILEVDLESGDRRIAADLELGADPQLRSIDGPALFYDPEREALFVLSDEGRLATVHVEPGTRHLVSDSATGQGPDIPIAALGFDPNGQRAIAIGNNGLYAIDPVSGDRALVSSADERGEGPPFGSLYAVAAGVDGGAGWVLSSQGVFRVNLDSGDREQRSGGGTGSGPALGFGAQLTLDLDRNRAIAVAGNGVRDLFAIDLTSGDRTVLSSASVGQGPAVDFDAVLLDPAHGRLLAVGGDQLVAVDPDSGDRMLIAGADRGEGPDFRALVSLVHDPYADRVLVVDSGANAVLAVDPDSGDRTILTGPNTGEGPLSGTVLGQAVVDGVRAQLLLINGDKLLSVELIARARTAVSDQVRGDLRATAVLRDGRRRDALYLADEKSPFSVLHLDLANDERTLLAPAGAPVWSLKQGRVLDELLLLTMPPATSAHGTAELHRLEAHAEAPELIASFDEGEGPFDLPRDVAWDGTRERILLADAGLSALLAVDPRSGDRTVVSGAGEGRGFALSAPAAICVDAPRDRAIVIDGGRVLAIDLEGGERTVLAGAGTDSDPPLVQPTAIACDPDAARAFIADDGSHQVVTLDLETGERAYGPLPRRIPFAPPLPAATTDLDPELQVLYVLQPSIPSALFALDLVTYEHVLLAGSGR